MGASDYVFDSYVLDPDGDVIITLRNFDAPFPPEPFEGEESYDEVPDDIEQTFDEQEEIAFTSKIGKSKKDKKKKKYRSSVVEEAVDEYAVAEDVATEAVAAEAVAAKAVAAEAVDEYAIAEYAVAEDVATEAVAAEEAVDEYAVAEEEQPELEPFPEAPADGSSEASAVVVPAPEEHLRSGDEPEPCTPDSGLFVQFQVSSAHLRLGSQYFKKALDGGFKESQSTADGFRHVDSEGWDKEAFHLVMKIIHGRSRQVPRNLDLQMLAKVATIVDYYECYEIFEPFSEIWYSQIQKSITPKTINKDLTLLLLVSWVFGWSKEFMAVTKIAHNRGKGPLSTMGLPIPERIICKDIPRAR